MTSTTILLTLPSFLALALLVVHSIRALPRSRAIAYWGCAFGYGVLRGAGVKWVIDTMPGASVPYAIKNPLLPVFGVPVQEIAGWAIVAYLGWWLGARLSRVVFVQVLWASVFLGAVSWAVEAAAEAAGWWTWSLPASVPWLLNVPSIAIVDWAFVSIDFLLPFIVLTSPAFRTRPWRFLSLLAFPVHFCAHLLAGAAAGPIPIHHLTHWVLAAILVWLAIRSTVEDRPFSERGISRRVVTLPLAAAWIILVDVAVALLVAKRPAQLVTLLPMVVVLGLTLRPVAGPLAWGRRHRTVAGPVAVLILAATAFWVHGSSAGRMQELTQRLNAAIAARDRGDLREAERLLTSLTKDFPGSHVPLILLGEIDYRTGKLEEARDALVRSIAIKPGERKTYRYLSVIDLRLGKKESATEYAAKGLTIDPADAELLYLSGRAQGRAGLDADLPLADPRSVMTIAALAYEVGDAPAAAAVLDRGIGQWPAERSLYQTRVKLALSAGDKSGAARVVAAWLAQLPMDAEARALSGKLTSSGK